MSHDSTFPDSPEAPESRTDRALEALQYEERAGLGFRRRQRNAIGNPYAQPEQFQVDREPTSGELWGGILAGTGAVIGFGAIFYKPVLLSVIALTFVVLGSLADGEPSRIAKWGMIMVITGFTLGMLMTIFLTNSPLF